MLKFIVTLVATVAVLILLALAGINFYWFTLPSFFYEILAFVSLTTFVLYAFLHKIQKPGIFVQLYLLTLVIKLLGGGVFLFTVALKDRSGLIQNATFFLIGYIIFTAIEILFLMRRNP